jgi:tripartite-type tricarboxylate transporter receptor subunit TctC
MFRQAFARVSFALLGSAVLATSALAQSFPSKMLNVVVPYPAGGASDFVARLIQPEYQKQLGQQLIVENIGGVAGALGVQKVLSAPADGHTQVLATPMELVLAPLALSAVKFKPEDIRLAGMIANTSVILLVSPNSPAKTIDEFVALAKGKELTVGNVGIGSMYHLMAEKFAQQAGVKFAHVPYKGGAPLMTDIAGGTLDAAFFPLAGPVPGMVKEGKLRAVGIAAAKPHPMFPAVPSISAHKTFPGFDYDIWIGVQVPKATPDAVVDRINTAMNAVLQNADVRKGLESTGSNVAAPMKRADLDRLYTSEIERYRNMAKGINLTPQ